MADTLDPSQAKSRFGELQHAQTRTYVEFEDKDGVWRPELIAGRLKGYRLYPKPKGGMTKWRKR